MLVQCRIHSLISEPLLGDKENRSRAATWTAAAAWTAEKTGTKEKCLMPPHWKAMFSCPIASWWTWCHTGPIVAMLGWMLSWIQGEPYRMLQLWFCGMLVFKFYQWNPSFKKKKKRIKLGRSNSGSVLLEMGAAQRADTLPRPLTLQAHIPHPLGVWEPLDHQSRCLRCQAKQLENTLYKRHW